MPPLKAACLAAIALASALLAGCASSGMGGGDIVRAGQPPQPVLISWKSNDGAIDGSMTATLPDGTFQGRFMEITRQTVSDGLGPLWAPWPVGWDDWPDEGVWAGASGWESESVSTQYSGKVIANLTDAGNRQMRCRIQLVTPDTGMKGGGTGRCKVAQGPTFTVTF
ncbi:hypothetical protein [Variovorax sp. OV329]|uniref:hypothetical protein n=1 Tax=Variovorax sp. OV329 TaxID=1882825 RepID=UPI0008E502EB|nr:hypothetical protein [Variovorax sp. OV329]SFM92150.1 hypothetical protein SAMN05444747_11142 [Variovorax sp. OV329]